MAFSLTHALVMTAPDDPAFENNPSDWNAAHTITGELAVANGGTGLASGTSGGVLYYSAAGTLASSALLAAGGLVVGGGAGTAPLTYSGLTFDGTLLTVPSLVINGSTAPVMGFYAGATNQLWYNLTSLACFRFLQAQIDFVGNGLLSWGDKTNTFSSSSTNLYIGRIANGVLGITANGSTTGAALQLTEQTAPAGAANSARLFTQDNGAGKTQLMVIFGSGAAQQIAIEA